MANAVNAFSERRWEGGHSAESVFLRPLVSLFLCATSGIPHELWSGLLFICYVDTDSAAALLMRPRQRQRSSQ